MSGAGNLPIGRIGRPHGVRGEVTLLPLVDDADDDGYFAVGSVFEVGSRSLEISSSRHHHQGRLIRFVGVETRDDAETLRGTVLSIESGDTEIPDAETPDVVGFGVHDRSGAVLGTVVAVEPNPAHDILVLDDGVMIPMPFVIDVAPGVVTVDPPEGLLELYR